MRCQDAPPRSPTRPRLLPLALALAAARTAAAADPTGAEPPAPAVGEPAEVAPSPDGTLRLVPFALPAYQPETSWMLGAAAVLVQQPPAGSGLKESQLALVAAVTVRGQVSVALQPDWYLAGDALLLSGGIAFARFPDLFYGIGNDTRTADEEHYTPMFSEVSAAPALRVAPALYLGPAVRFQHATMVELAPGGQLAQGTVPGSGGGTTLQLGASGAWDTRDSTIYPRAGTLVRLLALTAQPAMGSSFAFSLLRLDGRGYLTLPWGRHVLATQLVLELRGGEPPFYDTGRLGGDASMRGYYAGRYRDRQLATAQLEYRAPLAGRFGAVAFGSAGNVARDPAGLAERVKAAGGLGLRFAPLADVPVNVRLDVAYGSDVSFYLGMGEAF